MIFVPEPTKRKYGVLRLDAARCGWTDHEDAEGGYTNFVEIEATSPQDAVRQAFRDADPAPWECEPPVGGLWRADVRDPDGDLTRWVYEPRDELDGAPLIEAHPFAEKVDFELLLRDAEDHDWEDWYDWADDDAPVRTVDRVRTFPARTHAEAIAAALADRHEQELGCEWDDDHVFEVTAPGGLPRTLVYRVTDAVRPAPKTPAAG